MDSTDLPLLILRLAADKVLVMKEAKDGVEGNKFTGASCPYQYGYACSGGIWAAGAPGQSLMRSRLTMPAVTSMNTCWIAATVNFLRKTRKEVGKYGGKPSVRSQGR